MGHDHEDMLWREVAVDRVLKLRDEALTELGTERVSLGAIGGRVLTESIVADRDIPEHNHATMDGFAVDATENYPLDLIEDEIFPEEDPPSLESGQAVRIATGAPLPPEANAVLKREDAEVTNGELHGTEIDSGTYTYERGSNVEAGERLFAAGERLSPKDAILLRDLGVETVPVREHLSAGILATGTEIHEGRQADLDSPMLEGLVRSWGGEATYEGTVPDKADRVRRRVREVARQYDVVITTGGTSVGHKDYLIRTLNELGEVDFHRVRIRPGKPIAAARLPDQGAHAFAIPGKPVGAHTIAVLVMRPFFTGEAALPAVTAALARDVETGTMGFEYAIPVTVDREPAAETTDAIPRAMPLGHVDSPLEIYKSTFDPSVLSSSTRVTRADGFFLTRGDHTAGDTISVVPYSVVE